MPLKFCANLTFMFNEKDNLTDKYKAAREAGFSAVEVCNPYVAPAEELAKSAAEVGIEHVLINTPQSVDGSGTAALTHRREDFKKDLEQAIAYAKALKCPRVHVLAGKAPSQWKDVAMDEVYLENIMYAAERFEKENLTLMLEAVNPRVVAGYYLDCRKKAMDIIRKVNKPNVKLQLDIFHLQTLAGDLTHNIETYLPYTDHIQIAQAPDRNEPSTEGEINYQYILKLLEKLGYNGWIGLEYKPSTGSTAESLKWIKEWGYA